MAITLQDVRDRVLDAINVHLANDESPPAHLLQSYKNLKDEGGTGVNTEGGGLTEAQTTSSIDNADVTTHAAGILNSVDGLETLITASNSNLNNIQTSNDSINSNLADVEVITGSIDTKLTALDTKAASTNTSLTTIRTGIGAVADVAATTNTGNHSLISLLKRFLAHYFANKTLATSLISTSGNNTIIAAPPAGQRIVLTYLSIQGTSGVPTTCYLRHSSNFRHVRTTSDGTGIAEVYTAENAVRLPAGIGLSIDLSGPNSHLVSIGYYLETVTTKLPV